jgi:hypothetical protein
MRGPSAPTDRPRRDDIEAAVAALTTSDRAAIAVQLLITMFPRGSACRCSLVALSAASGLPRNTVHRWLAALVAVGLLSREGRKGVVTAYRLHLPRRRR